MGLLQKIKDIGSKLINKIRLNPMPKLSDTFKNIPKKYLTIRVGGAKPSIQPPTIQPVKLHDKPLVATNTMLKK